ncbi:MAG: RluA family pseudouridine synthase [Lachnospiraceae bacterium]|nr:RluA family pseudouridine synthase [Lachnospiraceae bacterium]
MKEFVIPKAEEGQKVIRFLNRILPNCTNGFLYKMFRKKNITINGKKISGKEVLKADDVVKIFFSDETFLAFSGKNGTNKNPYEGISYKNIEIVYEDDDILVCNKPSNVLSQKSKKDDVSINEMLISYLLDKGELTLDTLNIFKPSVINRLDRNTSGLILFGKTRAGLNYGANLMKSHDANKTYLCLVKGHYDGPNIIEGYLTKDEKNNLMTFHENETADSKFMSQDVFVIEYRNDVTLLSVKINTGRTHQIRCGLSYYGYPIVGDVKYGDREFNKKMRALGVNRALLHSSSIFINGKKITCKTPDIFSKVM